MKFFCNNISFIRRIIIIALTLIIIALLMLSRCNIKYKRVFNNNEMEQFIIQKGTIDEKVVSFACKVDWGNEYIDEMLDLFDKYDVKITFFPTGKWAEEYPGIVKKLCEHGHEIGNNGYFNKSYEKLSYADAYEDIKNADKLLRSLTLYDIKLFSPPSGLYNNNVIKAAINLGYPGIIIPSIDTMDWMRNTSEDIIYKNIFNKLDRCDIILIHPTKSTVGALNNAIEDLLQEQYKIVPVSEMLKKQ